MRGLSTTPASSRTGPPRRAWPASTRAPSARLATARSRSVCTPPRMRRPHHPGWRLFLPQSWDDRSTTDPEAVTAITARRRRSGVPDTEHHRTKWEMAIEMIDELTEWGCTPPTAVADAGHGDSTAFFARAARARHRLRCRRQRVGHRLPRRRNPGVAGPQRSRASTRPALPGRGPEL